jgi:hypothetical protein
MSVSTLHMVVERLKYHYTWLERAFAFFQRVSVSELSPVSRTSAPPLGRSCSLASVRLQLIPSLYYHEVFDTPGQIEIKRARQRQSQSQLGAMDAAGSKGCRIPELGLREHNGISPLLNVKANVGTLSKLRKLRSRLREQEQRLFAMTLPRRLGRVSQSDVTQPNGSPSDRFHSLLTQAAQIMELKKQQTKLQELLERQVATINGLQEEIQLKDKALDLQQQELERHRKHIAELELELEENEVDDALDVAEHIYLLRDVVAEVYRSQMRFDLSSSTIPILDGADESLASSGCSMKATVNAHFPRAERIEKKPAVNVVRSVNRPQAERRFLV